jgi:hypothetical protein
VFADVDAVGYETQWLAVGFVDLVGSTSLGEQLSLRDLGGVLTTFEQLATDTVTASGGRVVKLIGDEVLYTTPDAVSACTLALDLSQVCRDHPLLPSVRAGVAMGRVMLRDGDVFGPVVNLAARLVKAAEPGESSPPQMPRMRLDSAPKPAAAIGSRAEQATLNYDGSSAADPPPRTSAVDTPTGDATSRQTCRSGLRRSVRRADREGCAVRRVLRSGGCYYASTTGRDNDPEVMWEGDPPSSFDAEEAAAIVARVFDGVEQERWDGKFFPLATREKVRAYCRHHHIPAERGEQAELPLWLTKRGVLVRATKS